MKAQELRIKNYVLHGDKLCRVWAIFISHFTVVDENGIDHGNSIQENYQPIPLTEEWLLKFGFDKTSEYAYNVYVKANVLIKGGNDFYCTGVKVKIEYVHQLQNLYFALTGKELIP